MNLLLELPISDAGDFNMVAAMGVVPEDTDNAMLLTAALFQKAKNGDVAAYREIRDLVGESAAAQPNQAEDDPITRSLKEAAKDGVF